MPSMANITVVDPSAVNVLYTAATPSAGDRSPAVWRANALSGIIGNRPVFTVLSRDNTRRNGRHFTISMRFPILRTDLATGFESIVAVVPISLEMTVPTNVEADGAYAAFYEFGNLLVSTLVRSSVLEGYAPT